MINKLSFGENLPTQTGLYIRVKEKGDQVRFRIAQEPVYSGKHFMKIGDKWDVTSCARVSDQDHCEYCDMYFKGMQEAKKTEETDPEKAEQTREAARKYSASIIFYLPILDRDNQEFKILQTTMGIRNKINEYYEAGTKVFERDWILRNTGAKGKERYSIVPVDSSESSPLTPKEVEEIKKAKTFDTSSINDGVSQKDEDIVDDVSSI